MKHATGMEQSEKETYKKHKSYMLTWRNEKHYFRKYQSYGISISDLDSFPEDITHVVIFYAKEKGQPFTHFYLTKIEQWKEGRLWNNILTDRTPDPQKHVAVREMIDYKNVEDVPEPN